MPPAPRCSSGDEWLAQALYRYPRACHEEHWGVQSLRRPTPAPPPGSQQATESGGEEQPCRGLGHIRGHRLPKERMTIAVGGRARRPPNDVPHRINAVGPGIGKPGGQEGVEVDDAGGSARPQQRVVVAGAKGAGEG